LQNAPDYINAICVLITPLMSGYCTAEKGNNEFRFLRIPWFSFVRSHFVSICSCWFWRV
jgi:hypothetical protein